MREFKPAHDLIREEFALLTLRRNMPQLRRASYRMRAGRLPGVKLPVGLRTGHTATLRVSPQQSDRVSLIYRREAQRARQVRGGDQAVRFRSCPAETPAFSHRGKVGPLTGWAGALRVSGPLCVRLQVQVDGEPREEIRLPLGRPCA